MAKLAKKCPKRGYPPEKAHFFECARAKVKFFGKRGLTDNFGEAVLLSIYHFFFLNRFLHGAESWRIYDTPLEEGGGGL